MRKKDPLLLKATTTGGFTVTATQPAEACEPIRANEREPIPGHAGLPLDQFLLYPGLGDVLWENWKCNQARG